MATLGRAVAVVVVILGSTAAAVGGATMAAAGPEQTPRAPCYNGVFPLNPNVNNCSLPSRPPRVLGSAPDQTAILNCGNSAWRAQCISLYVNGGYGWYPGAVLAPGYHP